MSKTYLGTSGVVVMPVITATGPDGWDAPLDDVHLSYPGYPDSIPRGWTYDDETETIDGYFSGRASEGYVYAGYAVMAMNFPYENGIVDLEITFKRNGGSGYWNEHYWITREPRTFLMKTDQHGDDYFITDFSTAAGDIEFSIPDSGTVVVTIKDFDFDNDYLYVYAYCVGGGSGGKIYRPQITDMTYYYHEYKLSPVKLQGAESN